MQVNWGQKSNLYDTVFCVQKCVKAPVMWRASDVVLRSFQTTPQNKKKYPKKKEKERQYVFFTSPVLQRRYFLTKCDFSVYGTIVDQSKGKATKLTHIENKNNQKNIDGRYLNEYKESGGVPSCAQPQISRKKREYTLIFLSCHRK